jgi:hypothetical protein
VATAKPRSAKISASSSITWLTGWTVPSGAAGAGSVMSSRSVARRASSAAASSAAFFAAMRVGDLGAQPVDAGRFLLPLLGRHAAERLHQRRDLRRLAERLHPHHLDRVEAGGGIDLGGERGAEGGYFHHCLLRHSGESRNPRIWSGENASEPPTWIPAFAGMTN